MKKIKIIILTLFVATTFVACKKSVDLYPTDRISDDKAITDMSDLQAAVNTVYARMGTHANDVYVSAFMSDEARLGTDNSGQAALEY
ncbi:unnamed protein product, partial [Rotaria sp. Silwood1]